MLNPADKSDLAVHPASLNDPAYLRAKHQAGLSYADYLATGQPHQIENWQQIHQQVELTPQQQAVLNGFVRKIKVLVLSGIWCGDCVQQGPLLQRIAEARPDLIDLRWLDRDEHEDLQQLLRVNGGNRVPVVVFMAEDDELVGWFGDRTLSRYRALAQRQLGPACPLPGAAVDAQELAATLQDWVDQFERTHLILRLSTRLRARHND